MIFQFRIYNIYDGLNYQYPSLIYVRLPSGGSLEWKCEVQ